MDEMPLRQRINGLPTDAQAGPQGLFSANPDMAKPATSAHGWLQGGLPLAAAEANGSILFCGAKDNDQQIRVPAARVANAAEGLAASGGYWRVRTDGSDHARLRGAEAHRGMASGNSSILQPPRGRKSLPGSNKPHNNLMTRQKAAGGQEAAHSLDCRAPQDDLPYNLMAGRPSLALAPRGRVTALNRKGLTPFPPEG
ncbi:hypothetical protein AAU61_05475 [Desulfocarbo indianensis]|nr:hypothetical protein AAU61_05475 [Desulfocarbo indianensis]